MLLELAESIGLKPQRISSNPKGEFKSACPICNGQDRFIIWESKDRFWCRRCHVNGDSIQFCRNFIGMSFQESREKVGKTPSLLKMKPNVVAPVRLPKDSWISRASAFVDSCHQRLMNDPAKIAELAVTRGLHLDSLRIFRVGINPVETFPRRSDWGLPEDESHLNICLPQGLVIPSFNRDLLSAIKIRRLSWQPGDKWPKYHQVPGGTNILPCFGFRSNKTAVLVESELDAMLLVQEIGEFCTCIALGGAGKKPDPFTTSWLQDRSLILYALDNDQAGLEQYEWWRRTFPQLRAWRANSNKSPADSFLYDKIKLSEWFTEGVYFSNEKLQKSQNL